MTPWEDLKSLTVHDVLACLFWILVACATCIGGEMLLRALTD